MITTPLSDKVISVTASLIKKEKKNIAYKILLDYNNRLKQLSDIDIGEREKRLGIYYESNIKPYESI